jgi:hypothetical protein
MCLASQNDQPHTALVLRPDILIGFFTKTSPYLLCAVQTHLGGGHLFDKILYKTVLSHIRENLCVVKNGFVPEENKTYIRTYICFCYVYTGKVASRLLHVMRRREANTLQCHACMYAPRRATKEASIFLRASR